MLSVFGGTGFIGRNFCENNPHLPIERDKTCPKSSDILYFISTTNNYNVLLDPLKDANTNILHLLRVLCWCLPGDTFNFVSSWFVYGDGPILPARENSYCDPKGFYSITKRCAEQLLVSYCETHKINYRIFRLANVYGLGDKFSKKKNAMQWLVNEVKEGRDVELYHGGNTVRDYIHVRDVVRALGICLERAPLNSITNIGSGKKYKMKKIIEFAKEITGSKSQVLSVLPTEFHKQVQVKDFYMDVSRLNSYGFKHEITLKEGIRELCR